jgi:opacity protein-like surface antigen
MRTRLLSSPVFAGMFLLLQGNVSAQFATTRVKSKHEAYKDSLRQLDYNYIFPLLGQEAYRKGFDIPYPAGVMGNFIWMNQGVVLNNLQLGLKSDNLDIPLTDVDVIQFGENTNTSYTVNVRPDLWILPFLNVYGIFGYGNSRTEVKIVSPVELSTSVEQNLSTTGFGVMVAGGVGPVWISADANWTWNKPELLDRAVMVNVIGIRMGHTFQFKEKPDRNFALWVGGMWASMASSTVGEISMIDALPADVWNRRDELVGEYWEWYDGLNPNNPLDRVKIEQADEILSPIIDRLEDADGSSIVRYGMEKQVKHKWNGVIGMQYQFNKEWMVRSEAGVIGDRKSFMISVNYRFLV